MSTPRARSAIVVGASGLVGRALLQQLAQPDSGYVTVHALVRRPIEPAPAKVQQHRVDFAQLPVLPAADDLYCALGTTIRVAGSQAAFRAVDFDAVLSCARAARAAGVRRMALVSALGAAPGAAAFYNRVKGETEAALRQMKFERLVIARPSLLVGPRAALGQPARPAEALMVRLTAPIARWLPAAIRPIDAQVVARALIRALRAEDADVQVLESAALQRLGAP